MRAQERAGQWVQVFNGIVSGQIDVGSRTPLTSIPEWVTLEVVTGGFSTGKLLAGGALQSHEKDLRSRLGITTAEGDRQPLNSYFLSEAGLAELHQLLKTGCYKINYPEESVLLFVAWMAENGYANRARFLLEEIVPFFSRLRFFPVPAEVPSVAGSQVYLQSVKDTLLALRELRCKQQILAQKETVLVWLPLYDRTVELFFETVAGDPPLLLTQGGTTTTIGGWPCRQFPGAWVARARQLLDEYNATRRVHNLCGKPENRKFSFAQLRNYLQSCISDPAALAPQDIGRIRLILARYNTKHGLPGSDKCRMQRTTQVAQIDHPTFKELSAVVIKRMEPLIQDGGLDEIVPFIQPVSEDEAGVFNIPPGTAIPETLVRKVRRSQRDDIGVLIEQGLITSGDSLAQVLPQITAELKASGISDPALRRLYALNYKAFSKRRSLLLVDLAHQIQLEELPWVRAIEPLRLPNMADRELARHALEEIVVLALLEFPYSIIPNKLLQELRTLINLARLEIPIVEEIAADIFMGRFSNKYLHAAVLSSTYVADSIYTRYYGIDASEIKALAKRPWRFPLLFRRPLKEADRLAVHCAKRAGVNLGTWQPSTNGMIIEQQQILTTQNLATLYDSLALAGPLAPFLEAMIQKVFTWISNRLQVKTADYHARLIAIKNCAYAWRQMVFFMSQLPHDRTASVLDWCSDQLRHEQPQFQQQFQPVMRGLRLAAQGMQIDSPEAAALGAKRFLGWSDRMHWLLYNEDD